MVNSVQSLNNINAQRLAFSGEAGYAKTNAYPNDSYEKQSGGSKLLFLATLITAFAFRKNIAKVIPNCVKEFTAKWVKNPIKDFVTKHDTLRNSANWIKKTYNGFLNKLKVNSAPIKAPSTSI